MEEEFFKSIVEKYILPEIPQLEPLYSGENTSPSPTEEGPQVRHHTSPPPYSHARTSARSSNTAIESLRDSHVEDWRYTSRLWEEGQVLNEMPTVEEETLSGIPIRYKVVVRLRGQCGEGQASSKRRAKHMASKDLSQKLGLFP